MTATALSSIWDGIDPEIIDVVREQRREAIWRETHTRDLVSYIRVLRGDGFQWSWYHYKLADALDRWVRGEWPRLQIYMPVRHSKSEMVGRILPGYIAGKYADVSQPIGLIYASHTGTIACKINREAQAYMVTPEYGRLFVDRRLPGADGKRDERHTCNENEWEYLVKRGAIFQRGASYICKGVGGGLGGFDGSFVIVDDLIPGRDEAESQAYRDQAWNWLKAVIMGRLQPVREQNGSQTEGRLLITTTRWHPDDPTGRLLRMMKEHGNLDGWKVITLPAIMDEAARNDPIRQYMPPEFEDPREIGEALWPERFDIATMEKRKVAVGPYDWNSIYQQRPMSEESNKINPEWFKRISADEYRGLFQTTEAA